MRAHNSRRAGYPGPGSPGGYATRRSSYAVQSLPPGARTDRSELRPCPKARACPGWSEIANTLGAVAVEPFMSDVVGIGIVNHAVISRDNKMLRRVGGLGQFLKGNQPGPFVFAGPAWRGQQGLTFGARGDCSGHQIADVSVSIGEDEILRRYIPVA